jgi:hypothetical protein
MGGRTEGLAYRPGGDHIGKRLNWRQAQEGNSGYPGAIAPGKPRDGMLCHRRDRRLRVRGPSASGNMQGAATGVGQQSLYRPLALSRSGRSG